MRLTAAMRRGFAAAALALAVGCGRDNGPEPAQQAPPPAPAGLGAVALEPLDGPRKTVGDYGGKILVVNFVATWNRDSRALVPIMNEIRRVFAANVNVIGISVDDRGEAALRAFVRENDARFDIFKGDAAVAGRFGGAGRLPTTVVLTREAEVFGRIEGLRDYRYYHDFLIKMYERRM